MKFSFVTTFNNDGFKKYGKRFLKGFIEHFPKEVDLYVFLEDVKGDQIPLADNIHYKDLTKIQPLMDFKARHKNNKEAHGYRITNGRSVLNYRYDAVKFSHIIFALTEMVDLETDWLIRIGADVIVTNDITVKDLEDNLHRTHYPVAGVKGKLQDNVICHYMGRKDWEHSETDFLAFNMHHENAKDFLKYFRKLYVSDELFKLEQHTDSWLFDCIRKDNENDNNVFHNMSEGCDGLHVWPQTWLGKYMEHLKGPVAKMENDDQAGQFKQLTDIIPQLKPKTIVETGVGDFERARAIISKALEFNDHIYYVGFDLFETATDKINKREKNTKIQEDHATIRGRIEMFRDEVKANNKMLTYCLIQGDTRETLKDWANDTIYLKGPDEEVKQVKISEFDLAIISGGKSVKTIQNDYDYLKNCNLIILDNVYKKDDDGKRPDITKWGANKTTENISTTPVVYKGNLKEGGVVGYKLTGKRSITKIHPKIITQNCVSDAHIQKQIRYSTQFSSIYQTYHRERLKTEIDKMGVELITKEQELKKIEKLQKVNWVIQCDSHTKVAVLVSGGPSVSDPNNSQYKENHKIIKKLSKKKDHYIYCVKHSHDTLIEKGIIPEGCFLLDPRDHVKDFISNPHPDVKYFPASMCAKTTWDRLLEKNSQIWGYHAGVGAAELDVLREIAPKSQVIGGGTTAATRGLMVLRILGFQHYIIIGQDSCYFDEKDMTELDKQERLKYQKVKVDDREFTVDPELLAAAQDMDSMLRQLPECKFEIVGDGLVSAMYDRINPPKADFDEVFRSFE